MSTDEGQIRRLTEILEQTNATLDPAEEASVLFSRGVRVLQLDEVILNRADAHLLDHVRQAAERWEEAKAAARAQPKEALLLGALADAGKPLTTLEAIRAAADWHPDYKPTQAEWDPWRDAWRRLTVQRRIQKSGLDPVGEFARWKPVSVPEAGWHPAVVEFWERQREYPGLCVALVPRGRSTMHGDICGKPEAEVATGSCGEHRQ